MKDMAAINELEALVSFYENTLHDIKTPISIIFLHVQNILRSMPEPEGHIGEWDDMRESLAVAMGHCTDVLSHIQSAPDSSRLALGLYVPRLAAHDAVAVASAVTSAMSAMAERKSVRLSFHASVAQRFMATDRELLERVLINIISNAIKFTPLEGSVRVTATFNAESAMFEVADSGAGFSEERLADVFKRRQGGAVTKGIGMSIVREIVLALGGSVSARNAEDVGAVVTVTMPIRECENKHPVDDMQMTLTESIL